MPEAVIVATGRSPIGRAGKGALVECRADDMTAQVVAEVLAKIPSLVPNEIDDLVLGCSSPSGEAGFNLARVVTTLLEWNVPGTTVTRHSASSLQAIRMAAHAIRADEGDAFLAAGVESVSRYFPRNPDQITQNPRFSDAQKRSKARAGAMSESWQPADGLPDAYIAMGQTAENVAQLEKVTRAEMDEFALLSQTRAAKSLANGFFEREIIGITTPSGAFVSEDDCPRPNTTLEGLASLQPVFRPDGSVTAGNCCPLNDGAAAVVVMSDRRARELEITPLARIVSSGVSALNPEIMGLGPVEAVRSALRRAGMTIDQIDLVEINEAFAAQVIPSARHLDVDWGKLNVHGGAIAIGHPFGMTGTRIMTTLLHSLQEDDLTFGLETMCIGGGQGMAMIIERLS